VTGWGGGGGVGGGWGQGQGTGETATNDLASFCDPLQESCILRANFPILTH
jgi:hypothetical protein